MVGKQLIEYIIQQIGNATNKYFLRKTDDEIIDLQKNTLTGTAEGQSIDIADSADMRLAKLDTIGRTVQDTTSTQDGDEYDSPSPEYPQEMIGCGENGSINLIVGNKNLFDKTTQINNYGYRWTDGQLYADTGYISTDFIPIKDISNLYSNYKFEVFLYNAEKVYIADLQRRVNYNSFEIPKNPIIPMYAKLAFPKNANHIDMTTVTDVIVTGDNEDMTYTPHEHQTYTIPVQQPMLEGDYFGEDGEHHVRGRIVLDGTETNWAERSDLSNENFICFRQSDYVEGEFISNSNGLCNYLPVVTEQTSQRNNVRFLNVAANGILITISRQIVNSVAEFKAFLAQKYANGKPLIVEYRRQQKIILPYTQAQKTALANLAKAKTYLGQTHIYSTDEISPNMKATYYKSLELVINDLTTRIEELEGGE